jgi:hypothetical protein
VDVRKLKLGRLEVDELVIHNDRSPRSAPADAS